MNDFFKMLKEDHEEVKGLLEELKELKGNESTKREELFQKLMKELVPHMKSEEGTFYPQILAKKEAREKALEGIEEHHVAEMVLAEERGAVGGQDERVQGTRGTPYRGRGGADIQKRAKGSDQRRV